LARYLALDWDHNQLHLVVANVSGGAVRVLHSAVWPEELPLSVASAATVGERLKERLKEAKISPAPVVASLGRDRVIVKDIRYPVVPDHEEPGVVRFQVIKELTGTTDDSAIDYVRVGETNGERRAIVLIAKRELVAAYQELCKAAGLKLAAVTPRPYGIAACVTRLAGTSVVMPAPEPADGAVGSLAVADGWAEFTVSRGDKLLLARSLTSGPNLAAEVRRSLAVYDGQGDNQPVRAVYVAGGSDNAALRERLQNLNSVPAYLLDPFAGSDNPEPPAPEKLGGFAGLVGLLYLRGDRAGLPINLAEPKQPRPPSDPNKRKVLIGVAAAAAVLLAIGGFAWSELNRLDRDVKKQMGINRELDAQVQVAEEDDKRLKALDGWADQNVNLLDEWYDLTDRFPEPDADHIRLTMLKADVIERSTNPKEKDKQQQHTGQMRLEGVLGPNFAPVDLLVARFIKDGYRSSGKDLKSIRGGRGNMEGFTQTFTLQKVEFDKRDPKSYSRRIEEKP
jgi:hypothetical protein